MSRKSTRAGAWPARRRAAAAGALAAATAATLTALAGPGEAAAVTTLSLTPRAGSTNVVVSGSGGDTTLRLGGAPARRGSLDVRQRSGYANLTPVTLGSDRTAVVVDRRTTTPAGGATEVDVRVRDHAGAWTEWTRARDGVTTALPVAGRTVQVRVLLTAAPDGRSPAVGDLTVAGADAKPVARPLAAPLSASVYATREGLVGGTTANGHVIVSEDHFVALPSRRALDDQNNGTYTVQVCTSAKCAWEPVWDIGPWNVHDDYWSPSATRESFQDLPQGRAEADAAYKDGYNGGKDGSGRTVANPAGIDLADGVFHGLGLSDNGYVTVTYLWTGTVTTGTVSVGGGYLTVRNAAGTSGAAVGMAGDHAKVPLQCSVQGTSVSGSQGTTATWIRVAAGKYVSAAWVSGASAVPAC